MEDIKLVDNDLCGPIIRCVGITAATEIYSKRLNNTLDEAQKQFTKLFGFSDPDSVMNSTDHESLSKMVGFFMGALLHQIRFSEELLEATRKNQVERVEEWYPELKPFKYDIAVDAEPFTLSITKIHK